MENSFTFLMIGFLYFVLGLPLFFQKINRNGLYGFRVEKTLSDDKYWYPVNKSSGKWFMICGIVIISAALMLPLFSWDKVFFFYAMIILVILGTLLPILIPYRLLKTLN